MPKKIKKSDEEWREQLSAEEYHVCREKGTESPFSGQYNDMKAAGEYRCTCCGQLLFESNTKYDSGSGWPSFWAPAADDAVATERDESLAPRIRTEVLCSACDAHLGHVFDDGPAPTQQRFCINSVAIQFSEQPGESENEVDE